MRNLNKYLNINKKGKSPAFFLKKNINSLHVKTIDSLLDYSKKAKIDSRICLHNNKKDKVQIMLNTLVRKKRYLYNYHPNNIEYYYIIYGKLLVSYFDKKIKKKKILKKNSTTIFKLNKNILHVTIPLTKYCMFLEVRNGPFKSKLDTIYSDKVEIV